MNATAAQGAAALTLAAQLYRKECEGSGIHENRFPSWQELDSNAKSHWIQMAEQQLGIGAETVVDKEHISGTAVLTKAMEMYAKSGIGGMPVKTQWDDLTNAKKQKWLDIARDHMGAVVARTYIGTKMTLGDYNKLRGWTMPAGEGMTFSQALDLLKAGSRLRRAGWNGAGQFVFMMDQNGRAYVFKGEHDPLELAPVLALKNAQNVVQPGWVPSQGDLFAADWQIA